MGEDSSKDEKIGIKEMHEVFWKCRDFEISNLWQRSIFLTAFLLLTLTAFGTIQSYLFSDTDYSNLKLIILHVSSYIIVLLGIVFSLIWILMAKGSKAWFEVYEAAISAIENEDKYLEEPVKSLGAFNYVHLKNYHGPIVNNRIFSTRAGTFSVSKLNIFIGQIFWYFWILLSILHIFYFAYFLNKTYPDSCIYYILPILLLLMMIGVNLAVIYNKSIRNSSINDYKRK